MEQFKTKSDIVNRFGLPTEKREGEGIIEWVYNFGTVSVASNFGNSNTRASVYGNSNSAYGSANTNSMNVTQFTQYSRYIKFTLDQQGNVMKWESQGVDLTVKTKIERPHHH